MTKSNLNVALIQTHLFWEDPEKNRTHIENKINMITDDVDLIILPEMFTSGFTMNAPKVAETMDGKTINWLKTIAKSKDLAIMGSLVISENDNYFNRFVCITPNGLLAQYDKRHTFTLAGEHKVYKAGTEKVVFNYLGWRICPLICYDPRFPVWARNVEDYDLLIYVANWPKPRINAWDALLKARAIENMCYCIGINRVGLDGLNYEYPGHSGAYDVLGYKLDQIKTDNEQVEIVTLEKSPIEKYRSKLNFLNDRDGFNLEV